jgi:hypothetical protein
MVLYSFTNAKDRQRPLVFRVLGFGWVVELALIRVWSQHDLSHKQALTWHNYHGCI